MAELSHAGPFITTAPSLVPGAHTLRRTLRNMATEEKNSGMDIATFFIIFDVLALSCIFFLDQTYKNKYLFHMKLESPERPPETFD